MWKLDREGNYFYRLNKLSSIRKGYVEGWRAGMPHLNVRNSKNSIIPSVHCVWFIEDDEDDRDDDFKAFETEKERDAYFKVIEDFLYKHGALL